MLVNARPPGHGNENNVPSKLFDYALCERAIVATKMSGVDEVLGPDAFYFDPANFNAGLRATLELAALTPRAELRRRGVNISERVKTEFNWLRQALPDGGIPPSIGRGLTSGDAFRSKNVCAATI